MALVSYSDDEESHSGEDSRSSYRNSTAGVSISDSPNRLSSSTTHSRQGAMLAESLKTTKPTAHAAHASIQSIIKRTVHKPPPRMREELDDPTLSSATSNSSNLASSADPHADNGQSMASTSNAVPNSEPSSREALMKQLLRPPLIDGVEDWGVPEAPSTPCDPALQAKIQHFRSLKLQGKHFNDSLMSNKAFRNPHIYAKLVEFVDVDEMGTKFPKHLWDPFDLQPEWYADKIAAKQKERSEQTVSSQATGKRTHIDFSSSSSSSRLASGKDQSALREKDHHRYRPYSDPSKRPEDRNGKRPSRFDQGVSDERDRRKDWGGADRSHGRDWRR